MKTCNKCFISKHENAFNKDGRCRDGLFGYCKECQQKKNRAYYAENSERILSRYRRRHQENLDHVRKVKRDWQSQNRKKVRERVFRRYGGERPACSCCGESQDEFLTIDHIDGGGTKHRRSCRDLYQWLEKNNFPDGFRVLCWNCNCSIGIKGYCPHDQARSKTSYSLPS